MSIVVTATSIPDVLILDPVVFGDHRGFFYESYNAREFTAATGLASTLYRTIIVGRMEVSFAAYITSCVDLRESSCE